MSDEDALWLLRNKADNLGHTPTMSEVNADRNMPSSGFYAARFGSFLRALGLAGLDCSGRTRGKRGEEDRA